jgi:hypothetical protein
MKTMTPRAALLAAVLLTPTSVIAQPVIQVPTYLLRQGTSQTLSLTVSGTTPQTGFNLRAQLGDGTGPIAEPRFTAVSFATPLWQQFPSTTLGGPLAGFEQYAQAGVIYTQSGVSAPASGELVRLTVSAVGSSTGLHPFRLSTHDFGVDSDFLAAGGNPIPTSITNGNLLVHGSALNIPAGVTARATAPLSLTSLTTLGTLDLREHPAVVAAPASTFRPLLASGAITSSLLGTGGAYNVAAIGLLPNTDSTGIRRFSTFRGLPVGPTDTLVFTTYAGDTNLDGILNATDFNAVLNGLTNNLTGWENGDIDHNGVVNPADWSLFSAAYTYVQAGGQPFSPRDTPANSIPEPAAPAVLLVAGLFFGRRSPHASTGSHVAAGRAS